MKLSINSLEGCPIRIRLVSGVLVLVSLFIPLAREYFLIKAKLVAFNPCTSVAPVRLALLIGNKVTAHASMNKTAAVWLERTGDTAVVVHTCPMTVLVDMIE